MFKRIKEMGLFNGNGSSSTASILTREQFQRAIEKERYRSDRGDHQYSLLVLALNLDKKSDSPRLQQVIREIRRRIRDVDEIGWYDKMQLGIILPYTSRDGAEQLAHQICKTIQPYLKTSRGALCDVYSYAPNAVDSAIDP